jgi:hypothetical protein
MIMTGLVVASSSRREFGWFDHTPLADETSMSGQFFFLDGGAGFGYILIGIGIVMLAFWSGYRMGSHRRRPPA